MKKLLTFSLPIFLVAYHLGMVHSAAFSSLNLDTNWDTFQCANENPIVDEKTIILTATGLNWPQDLFCLALRKNLKVSGGYEISTQLVNVAPRSGERNIGFAFNVKDENSYDYAYLRYLRSDCTVVEYGHVEKGTLGTKNSHLPCQKLSGNGWHIFRLSVNVNRDVDAYINGKKVGSFHAYFTSRGFGGVLVANGFNNVAEFRDFDISPQLADQDTNTPPAINPVSRQNMRLAPPGANTCDNGSVVQSECEAAVQIFANKASKIPGRSLLVGSGGTCNDGGWGQVPLGCSVQSGGDWAAHYKTGNRDTDAGCIHQMYQLVCYDSA